MKRVMTGGLLLATAGILVAASTVPPTIEQPGTQPLEGPAINYGCNCHVNTPNPEYEPVTTWQGSMMAHAMRDGLYWATVAIAEQTFLPGADPAVRGGAGDLCLRCHGPRGWLGGLSTPTDGSAFGSNEAEGVECEACHFMVDPDEPLSIPGTVEVQNGVYTAFDPDTGEGYYGAGEYVMNGNGERLGPYSDPYGNYHPMIPSGFVRKGEFCGTCHDVSNPAVGDLAHNNGVQVPLAAGSFSGILGGPVEDKAAFNNPPHAYGAVERTFSEWKAGALDTFSVNDFETLPAELRAAGGALDTAYHRAYDTESDADYADGTPRTFTCQTCHMSASNGVGCDKNGAPVRRDLPRHDLTGGGYWMPDVIVYQDNRGTLRLGTNLAQDVVDALALSKVRAEGMLRSAASLSTVQDASSILLTVTNLTGHKLISGYPEGRRMWLNLVWKDDQGVVVREDGAYGQIGRTEEDLDTVIHQVESLIDPEGTTVFQVTGGLDQAWAQQLIDLGYDSNLPLSYDRLTDLPDHTLGELAAAAEGTEIHSFHFVLNNVVIKDNRIPPFGFDYDEALTRSSLPVPASQYGDPGPGGVFDHQAQVRVAIPSGAASVHIRLMYQQTSWEYVQFLYQANDGLSPFLGAEGLNMLDAWLNTGMAPPFEMATADLVLTPVDAEIFSDGFESGNTSAWSGVGE